MTVPAMESKPELVAGKDSLIVEFYRGKNIFVTGATGFVGKMLLEKLFRTCPGVGKVYVLVRSKKGVSAENRVKNILEGPLFARLRREQPHFRSRVVAVPGDCGEPGIGLSSEDHEAIVKDVHIVFHGAATVKLNGSLREALAINVVGTRQVLQLAGEMKNLQVMMQISTAYSHCNQEHVREIVYDLPVHIDNVLNTVRNADDRTLSQMTPGIVGSWPNTYSYSKALAEDLVRAQGGNLPSAIFRPAIVTATAKDPMPGWIDNLYGPTGVIVFSELGMIRVQQCSGDCTAGIVPGDMVVNGLLAAAWETAHLTADERQMAGGVPVYNFVASPSNPLTWGAFATRMAQSVRRLPSIRAVAPCSSLLLLPSRALYRCLAAVLHFMPALALDILNIFSEKRFQLTKAHTRMFAYSEAIGFFASREWHFQRDRLPALWMRLGQTDRELFYFDMEDVDWDDYMHQYVSGTRAYMLKEDTATVPDALKRQHSLVRRRRLLLSLVLALVTWLSSGVIRGAIRRWF